MPGSLCLKETVETMEARCGKAQRIWVVNRGMVSQDNAGFLRIPRRVRCFVRLEEVFATSAERSPAQ